MGRSLLFVLFLALAACSVLTSPDEFSFVEADPGAPCESDGDCMESTRCLKLGGRIAGMEESKSSCWLGCANDPELCEGTGYPFCFPYGADDSVCLAEARLAGAFSCPATASEDPGIAPVLTLGSGDPVILSACSLHFDPDAEQIGIEFSGMAPGEEGTSYAITVVLPNRVFRPGEEIHDLSATAFTGGAIASKPAAIFPPTDLASWPALQPSVAKVIQTDLSEPGGTIRGEVDLHGLVYAAGL